MESEEKLKEIVQLLTSHQEPLRMFIQSLLPNHADTLDILQEVNIVLWEKRDEFQSGSNFAAWARQIARYKVMNHCKSLRKRSHQVLDDAVLNRLADEAEEVDRHELEARRQALAACFERLAPEQRQMLQARYASPEELKRYLTRIGRSQESLRVTLFRVRKWLRNCLDHQLFEQGGGA